MKVFRRYSILWWLVAACVAVACSNEWENHYDAEGIQPKENLLDLINVDSDISVFASILKMTGMDSLLSADQSYTVWAPVNEALEGVEFADSGAMVRFVKNHVSRYSNPTSVSPATKIYMLNGKPMNYSIDGAFNGVQLIEGNIRANNGLLHKLSEELPYKYNILEYIGTYQEYSKVYEFVSRFVEEVYNAELSTTYDSVFVSYNRLLADKEYGIGTIDSEDSVYTMIVPNNEAWEYSYNRIRPYFRPYAKDVSVADSIQEVQTSLAILSGLTFRGRIDGSSLPDSVVTVTGNVIRGVKDYFKDYMPIEASNGMMYLAQGVMNLADTSVWNHTITVEAENMDYRINLPGTNSYIRTTDINSLVSGVSENSYLEVSSGNVDGGVVFDIPNTLSGKYDVYVDFVAPLIDGVALADEVTKVVFQLKYLGENGRQTTKNNNTATIVGGASNSGVISVLAYSGVELPVSDYYDSMWFLEEGNIPGNIAETTTLQVKTKVNNSDAKKGYLRKFRVDKVRFVPIVEQVE